MDNWIELKNLDFSYGSQRVLNGLSVSVPQSHRVVALVGSSGVGKSTLLSLIAGFLQPQRGEIKLFDKVLDESSRTPVVFQDHNLFPWKTVYGNVEFGLKAKGIRSSERRERVQHLMDKMGLGDKLELYPRDLSGGMKQRVGLARALAVEPDCILMDEPFSAIDHGTRAQIIAYFLESLEQFDANAVLVTHDMREAVSVASCVLKLAAPETLKKTEFEPVPWHELRNRDAEIQARIDKLGEASEIS